MYAHQQSFEQFKADMSKYVLDAKSKKSEIVVFPEDNIQNIIFDKPWNKEAFIELDGYYNDYKTYISKLAKANNIIIVGGTTIRIVDDKIFNTLIVGLPDGRVIEHDKIYLTPGEKKAGYDGEGDKILTLEYNGIKIVILVCYTSEFADISLKLAEINPDLIVIPSYTDDIFGLSRIQTAGKILAIQNFAYTITVGMVSNRDIDDLQDADGVSQALFTSPQQKEFTLDHLARAKFNQEQMISYNFDISKLQYARSKTSVFPNSNPKLNKNITLKTINV